MSVFNRLLVSTLPLVPRFVVGRVAARYVAGATLEDALRVVGELNRQGAMATVDLLGEEVSERGKALAAVEEYLRVFAAIRERGLDANVSIKLTLLGLKVDEAFCRDNVATIAAAARTHGNFVRIDMEDSTCTDATLRIYREVQARHGNLGVVLQAYMRRTLADIAELPRCSQGAAGTAAARGAAGGPGDARPRGVAGGQGDAGAREAAGGQGTAGARGAPGPAGSAPAAGSLHRANVRLCKGIYVERRRIAWKGYDTVRANFVRALEKMIELGVYPAIATHDEYLTARATALIDRHGLRRDQYEFQMLLGVDQELREILIAAGHRLRVYVPYGQDWYPYSIRRLRENPEVARHVLRALLAGR